MASTLDANVEAQLKAEGFPSYISYSFLETAKATNSIVLSRLPGAVGSDLISKGYDLKGFHIKAKSCNWGPMQGFICQLPLFNKSGISRVGYNAKEITHYLVHLKHFSGSKQKIWEAQETMKMNIEDIPALTPPTEKAALIDRYKKECDRIILGILKAERAKEETTGEWSGENGITTDYPFIPLKREFDVANLNATTMRGYKHAVKINETTWYGVAENVTDEITPENNNPSVITEFLLVKQPEGELWQIYHGRVKYKSGEGVTDPFDTVFNGATLTTKVDKDLLRDYAETLATVFAFDDEETVSFSGDADLEKMKYPATGTAIFGKPAAPAKFYRVRGFVNPFPPFSEKKDYHRNAVSGDYDLFAIWPSSEKVGYNELIRQSEYVSGRANRMGGKIFTTAVGNSNNFAIEFVPGFTELNPDPAKKTKPYNVLKESAEFGNMNSQCHLVSGLLNSFAATFITDPLIPEKDRIYSTANKGFHSDEGGRPGIMEIEFPIAVYMPVKFKTRALNNFSTLTRIPALNGRAATDTWAGLIKSPEELVVFILECLAKDYRVFMHYRWMIQLLYNTLESATNKEVLQRIITGNLAEIKKWNAKFKTEDNNLKDFVAIDANKVIIDARRDPETTENPTFKANLMQLLDCYRDSSDFFVVMRDLFLSFAFMPEMPSRKKRELFENIMKTQEKE